MREQTAPPQMLVMKWLQWYPDGVFVKPLKFTLNISCLGYTSGPSGTALSFHSHWSHLHIMLRWLLLLFTS